MATSKTGAESARRALELLFAFTEQRPVASVRELGDDLGIPLPTTHRYIALLRDLGLVEERNRGEYRLTMRVAALGRAARRAMPLVDLAEPFMRTLSEETEETVMLIRLVRGLPVCIHAIESSWPLRLSFESGQYLPPLRGASTRLLLGALSPSERRSYIDDALAGGAQPPVHGVNAFLSEIEHAATQGWSESHAEIGEGVWTASAIIREGPQVVAALSAPCPVFRLDEAKRAAIIEQVIATADRISQALSTREP